MIWIRLRQNQQSLLAKSLSYPHQMVAFYPMNVNPGILSTLVGRGYPANSDRLEHFSPHYGCCCHPRDNQKFIDAVQNPLGLKALHGTSFFRGRALDLWPKPSRVTCFGDWLVWFNHKYIYIEAIVIEISDGGCYTAFDYPLRWLRWVWAVWVLDNWILHRHWAGWPPTSAKGLDKT